MGEGEKQKLGVCACARESFFAGFSDLASCVGVGVGRDGGYRRGSRPNNGRLKWAFSLCGGRNGLEIHCGVRKNIVGFWGEMK